ncbi:hypothetical protein V1278_002709 [Bradyrhizobium sp. AZCC 1577]
MFHHVIPGHAKHELWGAPCTPENLEIPDMVLAHHSGNDDYSNFSLETISMPKPDSPL